MFIMNTWYVAAWSDEIKDAPLARRICNKPVAIFRDQNGDVGAVEDRCCHRGAPLHLGKVMEKGLQCGYHGLVFDKNGKCVDIPGQEKIPKNARVRGYPVVEKDQFIWIWMGEPELADPSKIVDYPFHNDTKNWPHKHDVYHVKSNYMLLVDNLMDLTHLAYVHVGSIGGSPKDTHEAKFDVTRTDMGLKFARWMFGVMPPPTYKKAVPDLADSVDRWQEFEYIAPGTVIQWSGATETGTGAFDKGLREGGFSLRIYHGLTPETETSCFYFWSAANGYRQDDPSATDQLFSEIDTAFQQDKHVVQLQQERLAELGEQGLIDVVADSARIHMRRTVDRLIDEDRQRSADHKEAVAG